MDLPILLVLAAALLVALAQLRRTRRANTRRDWRDAVYNPKQFRRPRHR